MRCFGPAGRGPALAIALACVACGDDCTDVDDWGPPAGHALVEGRVLGAGGLPVLTGMEVSLSRCESPIGGFAGRTSTTAGGAYSVRGDLPPIGPFGDVADSLLVRCELVAGRGFAESGPLEVFFFPAGRPPTVLHVDVRAR